MKVTAQMRLDWLRAVEHEHVSRNALAVAFAIQEHIDADGSCHPSRERLSSLTGLGLRTVARTIRELKRAGFTKIHSGHRKGNANTYVLTLPDSNGKVSILAHGVGQKATKRRVQNGTPTHKELNSGTAPPRKGVACPSELEKQRPEEPPVRYATAEEITAVFEKALGRKMGKSANG
jgi:hypothetical protein